MPDRTTIVLIFVATLLAAIAWWQGGPALALAGLVDGGRTLVSVIPLLIFAFLVAGLVQTLVSRDRAARWLGAEAGWRGIILACLGGALIPGGPYAYYPIAAALMHSGAGLGVLVAFVTAKNLWSVTRLPLEFALLGSHLTLIRLFVIFPVPPLMGLLAETFFGRQMERIRKAVAS